MRRLVAIFETAFDDLKTRFYGAALLSRVLQIRLTFLVLDDVDFVNRCSVETVHRLAILAGEMLEQ